MLEWCLESPFLTFFLIVGFIESCEAVMKCHYRKKVVELKLEIEREKNRESRVTELQ